MDIGTVSTVCIDPPPDDINEYWWNRWYNAKHGPERFRLNGVFAWRRFEIVPRVPKLELPAEHKYFTLSDQRDNSVLLSDQAMALVASNIAESKEAHTGEAIHVEGARRLWIQQALVGSASPQGYSSSSVSCTSCSTLMSASSTYRC